MKSVREIILDFTPLLDVIMVLFFYLMIHQHQTAGAAIEQAQQQAAQAQAVQVQVQQEAQAAQQAAQTAQQEAEALQAQAQRSLEAIEGVSALSGENYAALSDFGQSTNLKAALTGERGSWSIQLHCGGYEEEIPLYDLDAYNLAAALRLAGYTEPEKNVILCELLYDGDAEGSKAALARTQNVLAAIRKNYRYFYLSETDLSDWR